MSKETKSIIIVSIGTAIWGGTFPLVKFLLNYVSADMIVAYRFLFSAIFALPLFVIGLKKNKKSLLKLLLLSIILYAAYLTQTEGMKFTTSSKSGFITGLYVVFTPIVAVIMIKEKPPFKLILSLIISLIGLALLSGITFNNFSLNKGDLLIVLCALLWAFQIVLTNIYAKNTDANFITAAQMVIVFLLSLPLSERSLFMPHPLIVWLGLAFLGIFAGYLAILAETYSLKYIDPDRAAIIFTLEPVFAGLASFVFLGETLTRKGIVGAVFILVSMWIAISAKPQTE